MTQPVRKPQSAGPSHLPDLGPRGEGWVAIQVILFVAIGCAGYFGPLWSGTMRSAGEFAGTALIAIGVALALAGVATLRRQLTAYPKPVPGGRLMDGGAYALVRHPMYGGSIIAAMGWGLATASVVALACALLLWVFFDLKSRREEAWLVEQFDGYEAYRNRTHRLIPWLY